MAEVSGKADEEDGGGYEGGAGGDEGAAAAEAGGAAVAVVADDGLDEHAGDGAAEPDESGPGVGNAKELDVGGEEGKLESPPELDAGGYCGHGNDLPLRAGGGFWRRRRRRRLLGCFNLH